jgi:hypothetical protein
MRNIKVAFLSLGLFACGGSSDKPAPTCQQAIGHYYSAGCSYFDGTVNPPAPIPQGQLVTACQDAAINAPASCQDELDTWLGCNNDVPTPSTTNEQCDCSVEYMMLLRCR